MDERDVRTMLRDLGDGVEPSNDLTRRARSTYRRRKTTRRVSAAVASVAAIGVAVTIAAFVLHDNGHRRVRTVEAPPKLGALVSPDELMSLSFVDDAHGFAVTGYDSTVRGNRLAATTDGGRTWHLEGAPIAGLESSDARAVEIGFTSRRDGYVSANDRAITHDAGHTWEIDELTYGQVVPVGDSIWATRQDPPMHHTIEESTDGGRTWRPIKSPSSGLLNSLVRPTRSTAFGVVDQSTVAATFDGGRSWQLSTVPCGDPRTRVLEVLAGDTQHPWVVCGNFSNADHDTSVPVSILRSLGGGRNFVRMASAPYGSRLIVGDATHAWIVGSGLRATNDGGKTWRQVDGVPPGALVDSVSLDAHRVWMLLRLANSTEGRVWRTTDGRHWERL